MKKTLFLFVFALLTTIVAAQDSLKVNVDSPGSLKYASIPKTITKLVISGFMDARDFRNLRDFYMSQLIILDLTDVTIKEYTGGAGTSIDVSVVSATYLANEIPQTSIFNNNKNTIKTIILPKGVTSIASLAFSGCTSLTNITFPAALKTIGSSAFAGCNGLTGNLTFPDGLTTIGFSAFRNCSRLNGITLPSGITSLGKATFINCSSLKNLSFNPELNSIGDSTFANCTGLATINFPDKITSIGISAFYRCSGLNSLTLPIGLLTIGDAAFNGCTGITGNLTIPAGVKAIVGETFFKCSNISSLTLPAGLTNIGHWAFSLCVNLKNIICLGTIPPIINVAFDAAPKGVVIVPAEAVWAYKNASVWAGFNIVGDKLTVNCATAGGLSAAITAANAPLTSIYNLTVTGVLNSSDILLMNKSMTALAYLDLSGAKIVDNILPDDAFKSKMKLTTILLPTSLVTIGNNAFQYCTGLMGEFKLPASVTSIGINAFGSCSGISSFNFSDGLTSIGNSAFSVCSGIKGTLTFPASLTSIGNNAFEHCLGITNINLPSSLTSIGIDAFSYCPGITGFSVPEANQNFTALDGVLFNKNQTELIQFPPSSTISAYIIPTSVTTIKSTSFLGCAGIISITLPSQLTSIETSAFLDCKGLTGTLALPEGLTVIGDFAFNRCSEITGITLPSTLKSIGIYAFLNCTKLTGSIIIPNSITKIADNTFYGCSLITSVTLPSGLTGIGVDAFRGCTSLKTITCLNTVPCSLGTTCFTGITTITDVFVKTEAAVTAYKANAGWIKYFPGSIIKLGAPNAIFNLADSRVKVYSSHSEIILEGTLQGEKVTIHNLNGKQILTMKSDGQRIVMPVLSNGMYLVKVADKSFKVIL